MKIQRHKSGKTARELKILGVVQGVGFRPFVAELADSLGIAGTVQNNGGIVTILAEGTAQAMDDFIHRLSSNPPAGAQVLDIRSQEIPVRGYSGFQIIGSSHNNTEIPVFPPDLPLCEHCLQELQNQKDRRYRYPLISCTSCGPRYSILQRLPYDRENTAMKGFAMCRPCREEYVGPGRRRHVQTISCHDCGPQMVLVSAGGAFEREKAMEQAVRILQSGGVLAFKGIGGYQLACRPDDADAVRRLRKYKLREKKPLAVMLPSLSAVKKLYDISRAEEELLTSTARPIVLVKGKNCFFTEEVSRESRFDGIFLPYTGVHQMLTGACGPLVMTSANLSGEPIIIQDKTMLQAAEGLDGVLYHSREILRPLDDSVARVVDGRPQLIRRSRGYVPFPIWISQKAERPALCLGGDLKACFSLAAEDRVYLSQYFGDMEHYGVTSVLERELAAMQDIFHVVPQQIACDLHPGYHTAVLAQRLAKQKGVPLLKIQHHHAHIASVMAEHGFSSCVGVAFDGTGYGEDGTVWGGEFLYCRDAEYVRMGCLAPVFLCGGDASAKDASLTALSYQAAYGVFGQDPRFSMVQAALRAQVNTVASSSMGRLFDAVSALLGIRGFNTYEGECAIALENAAARALEKGETPASLSFAVQERDGLLVADAGEMIRSLSRDIQAPEAYALGFHRAVARLICEICLRIREKTGENHIALSGGVFANLLLTRDALSLLRDRGFHVYLNQKVPCNDGGISLGQAFLAARIGEKQSKRRDSGGSLEE